MLFDPLLPAADDFDPVDRFAVELPPDERAAERVDPPLRLVELARPEPDADFAVERDDVERDDVERPVEAEREPVPPDERGDVERPVVPERLVVPERPEPDFAVVPEARDVVDLLVPDRAAAPPDFAEVPRPDVLRELPPEAVVFFFLSVSLVVVLFLGNFYLPVGACSSILVFHMAVESPVARARNCFRYPSCHSSLRMSGRPLPSLSMPSTSTSGPPIMKSVCTAE